MSRSAKLANSLPPVTEVPPDSLAKTISKDEINALPLRRYRGEIVLVSDDVAMESAISRLRKETMLGFDTESRPSFRKGENYPISLVQLASADAVFLFQVSKLDDPSPLRSILSDPSILKAGVAIRDDIRKLQELWEFEDKGFVEIADITRQLDINNTGLRSLAAIVLGFRISKNAQVSNWSRKDLTEAQQVYAATDAWVSRELFVRLEGLGLHETLASVSQ